MIKTFIENHKMGENVSNISNKLVAILYIKALWNKKEDKKPNWKMSQR